MRLFVDRRVVYMNHKSLKKYVFRKSYIQENILTLLHTRFVFFHSFITHSTKIWYFDINLMLESIKIYITILLYSKFIDNKPIADSTLWALEDPLRICRFFDGGYENYWNWKSIKIALHFHLLNVYEPDLEWLHSAHSPPSTITSTLSTAYRRLFIDCEHKTRLTLIETWFVVVKRLFGVVD